MNRQHQRRRGAARVVSIVVVVTAAACGGLLDGGGRYVACPSEDPSSVACTHAADECPRTYVACDGETRQDTCVCSGQLLWGCPTRASCDDDASADAPHAAPHDASNEEAAPPAATTCAPEGPTSCEACIAASCCAVLTACNASPTCTQWKSCVEHCESPTTSAFACAESTCSGFHDPSEAALYACATKACSAPCLQD